MKRLQRIRFAIQAISFALFSWAILHFWGAGGAHQVCPFAAIQAPLLALRHGIPLNFFVVGMVIGIFFFLLSFILPRTFCGWVCPIGFVSRILRWIGRKIGFNLHIRVKRNDRFAQLAVVILLLIVIATFISGKLVCIGGCPLFWGYAIWAMPIGPITAMLLAFFAIGSLGIERFFCRWFCPYGALLGIAGRFSFLAIRKKRLDCKTCRLCFDCPMGTLPKGAVVDGPMCISCMRCVDVCKDKRLYLGKRATKNKH